MEPEIRVDKMVDLDQVTRDMQRTCKGPVCFGHLRYVDGPIHEMVMLPNKQFMRANAARAFLDMAIEARMKEGINLLPAYCFRSYKFQFQLFIKWAKRLDAEFDRTVKRVAPAGYSEHHTGYAVDIHDGPDAKRATSLPFHKRPAYLWLAQNAHKFGFENSFHQQNAQGVMFEPWHWRWVGDEQSKSIFKAAQYLGQLSQEAPGVALAFQALPINRPSPDGTPDAWRKMAARLIEHENEVRIEQARIQKESA